MFDRFRHRFPALLASLLAMGTAFAAAPNLLLITLDTTRADHLGCYGRHEAATPNLDRIAAEGFLCERAMTTAPMTLPAHASILTGLYPPGHGVRDNADFSLPESIPTLATQLRAHGYRTAAVVSSIVLSKGRGLARGFDSYDEPDQVAPPRGPYRPILERIAAATTDRALAELTRSTGRPLFLWIHYYDPHADYSPPPPWRDRFASSPYDGEIAYMDSQVGRIFDTLRRSGELDRTLVAIAGDHGESLGEHGEASHGLFLYDATLRVPLLLRWPGQVRAGARFDDVVSLAGLAPTLLELLQLPPLPRLNEASGPPGRSFAGAARASARALPSRGSNEPVYAEAVNASRVYGWAPLYALRDRTMKFIEAPEPELYDLGLDPGERSNRLAGDSPDLVAGWRARLAGISPASRTASPAPAGTPLDPAEREKLLSLGYLAGGATAPVRPSPQDPKRLVAVSEQILRSHALLEAGRAEEALALLERALAADPGNPAALGMAGSLQFMRGERDAGIARLAASVAAAPGVYETRRNYADALHSSGDLHLSEAIREYRAAIAISPASDAYEGLGRALLAQGEFRESARALGESIRLEGVTAQRLAALGAALGGAGDLQGAEARLRESLAIDPSFPPTWVQLGVILERAGRPDEARQAYDSAVAAAPIGTGVRNDAIFDRGLLAVRTGRLKEARDDLARLPAAQPSGSRTGGSQPGGMQTDIAQPGYAPAALLQAAIELASGNRASGERILRDLLARPSLDPRVKKAALALQDLAGSGLSDQSRSDP